MQKGFLSSGRAKARGGGSGRASTGVAATPAAEEGEAKPMPPPPPPPRPPPPAAATPPADPSSSSRALDDCLDLLRGPTDERRLVGLLLATRVLPKGDTTALSAAREAIGDAFLARLLLPLDSFGDPGAQEISDFFQASSSSSSVDPERTLREAGQISLSLAVSSAFAGGLGVQFAGSEEFLALAPRWCKVVAARGAVAALGGLPQAAAAASYNPESEEAATRDALNCLLAAALSGPRGREAAAAAGGAAVAARAMAGVASSSNKTLPQWLGRAARLLALLLPVATIGRKKNAAAAAAAAASDDDLAVAAAAAAAAPALASLLCPPQEALLAGAAAAAAAKAAGKPSPECDAASDQLDALAAFDALASRLDGVEGENALAAATATARAALARSAASPSLPSWPCAARAGLAGLLRARAGPSVRHAALRVSAFIASLVSEGSDGRASWLLMEPPATATAAKSKNDDASAPEFLRVLSEVSRVEAALLFRDAEDGDALVAVPEAARFGGGGEAGRGGDGGNSAAAAAAAATSSASASPAAGVDEDEDDDDSSLEPPPRLNVTEGDLKAAVGRWHEKKEKKTGNGSGGGEGLSSSSFPPEREKAEQQNLEPAACRAERTLPSVLALVEAALDALANDAEAGDRRARERKRSGGGGGGGDTEVDDILGGAENDDDDDGFSGELFSDEIAVRAFSSLKDAVEQGLDYLEGRAPGLVQSQASMSNSPPSSANASASRASLSPSERAARSLAPAAARCLGRLLADAPAAFGARPRTLLPSLLQLKCGNEGGGGTCGRFFLPVLSGALATEQHEDDDESGSEEERMVSSLSLDDGDAGAWLAAARKPAALAGLAATLAAACSDAAGRGGGGGGASDESESESGDGEVAAAAAVLTGLLPRPCPSCLPLRPLIVPALASWAASRLGKKKESAGKEREKRRKDDRGGASASLLSTANEVARALALLLVSPSSPATSPAPSQDLPDSAAAASSAALVACLRPGWAAWALRSEEKKKKKKKENEGSSEDKALLLRQGGGGELEELVEHGNEFGLAAAPLEDASHLPADDYCALADKLKRDIEESEGDEGLRFDGGEGGSHGERGWRRALRAAALVAESDSSSAAGALLFAASSAPWLRELLEEDEAAAAAGAAAAAIGAGTKTAAALRAFVGALRGRLMRVERA